MTIKNILDIEKRNETNLYEIHFFKEGIFWKAYEWSAYLCRVFPSELENNKRLKPLKKYCKKENKEYIQVGLQLTSFEKYFPCVVFNENAFKVNDEHIIIYSESFFHEKNFEDYEATLNKWKQDVDYRDMNEEKTSSHKKDKELRLLLKEIIEYSVEDKSLIENLQFLIQLKRKTIELLNNLFDK